MRAAGELSRSAFGWVHAVDDRGGEFAELGEDAVVGYLEGDDEGRVGVCGGLGAIEADLLLAADAVEVAAECEQVSAARVRGQPESA